ncbi:MAG TPA: histidine phosphatase family protein [Gaiellaceae bacterium]|nr:histidine phosphatase family protein [Gaiellaceae bacterium]
MRHPLRIVVLARHGESRGNAERRVSGNPAVDVPLTERGVEQARTLGLQVAGLALDACLHTRFPRTRATAELALAGREDVPLLEEPLFDDVDVGELDGAELERYREWKRAHTRADAFPGGESLDDAAARYAAGLRSILASPYRSLLVVCHEIPIRYALNAVAGSDSFDGPAHTIGNAVPHLFDDEGLERAVQGIERILRISP